VKHKPNKTERKNFLRRSREHEAEAHPSRKVKVKKKAGKKHQSELATEFKGLDVDTEMVRKYLTIHFHKPIKELRRLFEDDQLDFGEASIVSVMLRIYDTGDIYALNSLYDRMIGPILRKYHITGDRPYEQWTLSELLEEKKRLEVINRNTIDMIHKETKLIALVESGEIKPGEYTAYQAANDANEPIESRSGETGSSKATTG